MNDSVVTANLATIKARSHTLQSVVDSLKHQVTTVRIYGNDYLPEVEGDNVEVYSGNDYTDNAKFFWLPNSQGVYLSCDDDIIYPSNYTETILTALKKYPNTWVTFHGRRLLGENLPYYTGHKTYQCLRSVDADYVIDVPGTGVSAFHTDTIKFDMREWKDYRMSDLLTGLELARNKIRIICLQHRIFWIKSTDSHNIESIYKNEFKNTRQNELGNIIYRLNN